MITIYKIKCKDENVKDIYIGHTTNITKRIYNHKNRCMNENNNGYNLYIYQFMRQHGGFNNFIFEELIQYECTSKEDIYKYERYWIEKLNATLNSNCPIISLEEKRINSESYRETHRENRKTKTICICGSIIRKLDKKRHEQSNKHKKLLAEKQATI
jgi:hypothetical protein